MFVDDQILDFLQHLEQLEFEGQKFCRSLYEIDMTSHEAYQMETFAYLLCLGVYFNISKHIYILPAFKYLSPLEIVYLLRLICLKRTIHCF